MSINCLTKRVSRSNKDNWETLKKLLLWCKNTIHDPRIIGATSLTNMFTWIDAAYTVHLDMRSHNYGIMSMGLGVLQSKYSVNKLKTKSSAESEIVDVSEYLPYNI